MGPCPGGEKVVGIVSSEDLEMRMYYLNFLFWVEDHLEEELQVEYLWRLPQEEALQISVFLVFCRERKRGGVKE